MIIGRSASTFGQEIDLAVDAAADLLVIDPALDALMVSAAGGLTFTGASASAYGQEVDLAIDPAGDGLTIDLAGDRLVAISSIMNFAGFSAAFVVGSELVTEVGDMLLGESGVAIETEDR